MTTPNSAQTLQLTPEDRAHFKRDGVYVIRNFFSEQEVADIRATSDRLGAEASTILTTAIQTQTTAAELAAADPNALIVVPEAKDPTKVCRFEYILGRSPDFNGLITSRLLPLLRELGGEPFRAFKDKENEKHPGGGAFPPHQDFAAYQYFEPRYQITAAVAVDPCTVENGCLQFASDWRRSVEEDIGSDKAVESRTPDGRPLLRFVKGGPMNGDILPEVANGMKWYHVPMGPRDLVLFDSFAPHRSEINNTKNSRRVLLLTFSPAVDGDWYTKYYQDKRYNYSDPKFHVSTPTKHAAVGKKAKL